MLDRRWLVLLNILCGMQCLLGERDDDVTMVKGVGNYSEKGVCLLVTMRDGGR